MESKNPFKKGSTSYYDFEILSDLKWHCTKCELKSGQAKTWQLWRHKGIQLGKNGDNYFKKIFCEKCENKTIHRKLLSIEVLEDTKTRSGISGGLAKKIKHYFGFEEAVFLRKLESNELEIDHKFPQIRWTSNEDVNYGEMSEKEIEKKFLLLSRSNNLLKSRNCEKCFREGKRGCFPGIRFWYKGDELWNKAINGNDEKGCIGCFWYDPYAWREELNRIVNK